MEHYKESIHTFNHLAQGYQDKFMNVEIYNDSYNSLIKHIKNSGAKILDAGCGPGNISRYLLQKEPGYQILGIDMAPKMIELAQNNNPGAKFKIWDCLKLDELNEKFDSIICGFCMPYLSGEECALLIKQSASVLNTNGVFYCSVIEDDPIKSGYEMSSNGESKAYVYYHEEKYLLNALQKSSIHVLETTRIPYSKNDGNIQTHLVLIGRLNSEL